MLCICCSGSLVTVRGLLTFTSNRSMEIEVIVECESIFSKQSGEAAAANGEKAVDAFFTFVSIDNNGKALAVPSLVVSSACTLYRMNNFVINIHILCANTVCLMSRYVY